MLRKKRIQIGYHPDSDLFYSGYFINLLHVHFFNHSTDAHTTAANTTQALNSNTDIQTCISFMLYLLMHIWLTR